MSKYNVGCSTWGVDVQRGINVQRGVDDQRDVNVQRGVDVQRGVNVQRDVNVQRGVDVQRGALRYNVRCSMEMEMERWSIYICQSWQLTYLISSRF